MINKQFEAIKTSLLKEISDTLSKITVMECEECGTLALAGARTDHRTHMKYCSDRCRVAGNRRKKRAELAAE